MDCISRKEAKRLGRSYYFTGEPCKRGHVAVRHTSGAQCSECKKLQSKKDKERRTDEYKERQKIRSRLYRQQNKEKQSEYFKNRYKNNREFYRGYFKDHYQQTKDRRVEYQKKWRQENPDAARMQASKRRAAKASSEGTYSSKDVKRIISAQKNKCASCNGCLKKLGYHVDHVMPLSKGGSNGPDNLQILCPKCNLSKGAKDPIDWAEEKGRLL